MDHEQAQSNFSDYVDGSLTERLRAEVDQHLAACIQCRTELTGFRETVGSLGRLKQAAPPSFLGDIKQQITDAILNSGIRAEKADWDEYRYYPTQFFEPYLTRRRANGFGLYGALGIGRREVDKMRAQHDRNFVFFDAPVGMIFTIDRRLNQGSWIDYGMFLQNIMVAARGRGLHTCPQAAFAPYHRQIRPVLNIPDEEIVVCGMALGLEDTSKPENDFRTDRVPLEEWVTFSE